MSIRVAGVESDRALGELVSLGIVKFDLVGPPEIGRVADRDRQRRSGLSVVRVDRESAPEKTLRLNIVSFTVPIMVPLLCR